MTTTTTSNSFSCFPSNELEPDVTNIAKKLNVARLQLVETNRCADNFRQHDGPRLARLRGVWVKNPLWTVGRNKSDATCTTGNGWINNGNGDDSRKIKRQVLRSISLREEGEKKRRKRKKEEKEGGEDESQGETNARGKKKETKNNI